MVNSVNPYLLCMNWVYTVFSGLSVPIFSVNETAQHFLQESMCSQRRHRSACAFLQSDQSLHRALLGQPRIQTVLRRTAINDSLTLVFAGSICNLIGNVMPRLKYGYMNEKQDSEIQNQRFLYCRNQAV